jgi:hypothetical protein
LVVFIDESYQKDSSGVWHYALAGFAVNEFRYRAIQAATYQLVRQFFDVQANYEGEAWREALADKIIVEKSHDDIELKASYLLKASSLRKFGGEKSPHHRLVAEILENVSRCRGTSFGVLVNPDDPQQVKSCSDGCPPVYTRLIEMVARWMQEEHPGEHVSPVLDTEHSGVNLPLSRSIADFLYRSRVGQNMRNVFPAPFWIDSQSMAGAQVADLIAHILMNSMMPEGERKPLKVLTGTVFDLSHRWQKSPGGTITRLRKVTADGGASRRH